MGESVGDIDAAVVRQGEQLHEILLVDRRERLRSFVVDQALSNAFEKLLVRQWHMQTVHRGANEAEI